MSTFCSAQNIPKKHFQNLPRLPGISKKREKIAKFGRKIGKSWQKVKNVTNQAGKPKF